MKTIKSFRAMTREEMQSTVGGGLGSCPLGCRRPKLLSVPGMTMPRPGALMSESNPQPSP